MVVGPPSATSDRELAQICFNQKWALAYMLEGGGVAEDMWTLVWMSVLSAPSSCSSPSFSPMGPCTLAGPLPQSAQHPTVLGLGSSIAPCQHQTRVPRTRLCSSKLGPKCRAGPSTGEGYDVTWWSQTPPLALCYGRGPGQDVPSWKRQEPPYYLTRSW